MKPTSKNWVRGTVAALGLALCFGFVSLLHADEGDGGSQPGRAVRLSSVDGQVQVAQGGQMLADAAVANTPLFEGTELTTGSDGRAEVQFEDGSVARIPPGSSLALSVLRPNGDTELVLSGGMGYFELQGGENPIRIRFGSNVVTASGFTVLRLKLDEGPPSVAVFNGNAHLEGPAVAVDLHGGESVALNGAGSPDANVAESIEPDSWDAWNSDRDQALTASETAPTEVEKGLPQSNNPAWGDLNANGTWYDIADQGYVWSPYEASNAGWDPYGTGSWMWTPGFGYVWVSGEPWGYMPYQCGAWNYYNSFGWGWAPGSCQTWWAGGVGGGGGGWYYTVGNTPKWYRLPVRPGPPRPRNPHPVERVQLQAALPLIPVHRSLPVQGMPLPPRDRGTPVAFGGTVATPLRPEPARPVYNHQQPPNSGYRSVTVAPPENGTGFVRERGAQNGTRPANPQTQDRGSWPAARPTSQPPAPVYRPAPSAQPSRPSYGGGGGGGGHSSPPPASHSSSPPASSGHPK